jgi:hypothetical protein
MLKCRASWLQNPKSSITMIYSFWAPKAGISFQCPSYPKQFSTLFCLQKSVATKPCVKIGCMSNQWEPMFVSGVFRIQCFWGGHGEISPNFLFVPKGQVCPFFPEFSKPAMFR